MVDTWINMHSLTGSASGWLFNNRFGIKSSNLLDIPKYWLHSLICIKAFDLSVKGDHTKNYRDHRDNNKINCIFRNSFIGINNLFKLNATLTKHVVDVSSLCPIICLKPKLNNSEPYNMIHIDTGSQILRTDCNSKNSVPQIIEPLISCSIVKFYKFSLLESKFFSFLHSRHKKFEWAFCNVLKKIENSKNFWNFGQNSRFCQSVIIYY